MAILSIENQAVLMRHKMRKLLVARRTRLLNALRGHMAEAGVIATGLGRTGKSLAGHLTADASTTRTPATEGSLCQATYQPLQNEMHRITLPTSDSFLIEPRRRD